MARYYRLLKKELAAIHLSQQEAMLIWYALIRLRGAGKGTRAFPSLAAAVAGEWRTRHGLSDMQEVDGRRLIARLEALRPAQTLALIDAWERLQTPVAARGWELLPKMLLEIGLLHD